MGLTLQTPGVALVERPPTDAELIEAVRIRGSECYGAMALANALGGARTPVWDLLHQTTFDGLLREAEARGIDVARLEAAVGGGRVVAGAGYRVALFNLRHPVGTVCRYVPDTAEYRKRLMAHDRPGSRSEAVRTSSRAYQMKHTLEPAVQCGGRGWSYLLRNLTPLSEL